MAFFNIQLVFKDITLPALALEHKSEIIIHFFFLELQADCAMLTLEQPDQLTTSQVPNALYFSVLSTMLAFAVSWKSTSHFVSITLY